MNKIKKGIKNKKKERGRQEREKIREAKERLQILKGELSSVGMNESH